MHVHSQTLFKSTVLVLLLLLVLVLLLLVVVFQMWHPSIPLQSSQSLI